MHYYISRILKSLSLVVVLSLLASSFAWGLLGLISVEKDTVTVKNSLLGSVADTLGVGEIGDTLYYVQEDVVHGTLRSAGVDVPHYYTNVCVDGDDNCLPVDPFELRK